MLVVTNCLHALTGGLYLCLSMPICKEILGGNFCQIHHDEVSW